MTSKLNFAACIFRMFELDAVLPEGSLNHAVDAISEVTHTLTVILTLALPQPCRRRYQTGPRCRMACSHPSVSSLGAT